MDLTDDGLRERLASIVTIEPDGKAWRVTLACGAQRSSIIRLSEQEACEAYAAWIREKILLPEFIALRDAARAEQREADAQYVNDNAKDVVDGFRLARAIRSQR